MTTTTTTTLLSAVSEDKPSRISRPTYPTVGDASPWKSLALWSLAHVAVFALEPISHHAASLFIYLPALVAFPFACNKIKAALCIGILHGICHIMLPFINKDKPMGVDPDFLPGWDLCIHLGMGAFSLSSFETTFAAAGYATPFRKYMTFIMAGNLLSAIMGFTVWTDPVGFDIMRYVTWCCSMNTAAFCAATMGHSCSPTNGVKLFVAISAAISTIHIVLLGFPNEISFLQDSRLFEVIAVVPGVLATIDAVSTKRCACAMRLCK